MFFTKKSIFSIRKLSVGIASVLIGASFLQSPVFADEQVSPQNHVQDQSSVTVSYVAVAEKDLSALEQELVIKAPISKEVAKQSDTYILVYRPKEQVNAKTLPKTNASDSLLPFVLAGGLVLAVYGLRKGKHQLLGLVVVGTIASAGLSEVQATQLLQALAEKSQTYVTGQALNDWSVAGYDYVGYLKAEDLPINSALRSLIKRPASQLMTGSQTVKESETVGSSKETPDDSVIAGQMSPQEKLSAHPSSSPMATPKPEAVINDVRRVESIPFEEERVPNANRYVDEAPVVLDEGEAGERVLITRQLLVSGQVVSEEELPAQISKPARTRRVEYGTKEREQTSVPSTYPTVESQPEAIINDIRRVEPIPFDEERVPNANRYVDEAPVVLDEGEAGERVLITRQLLVSGQVVSEEELPAEISKPSRTRRVEYGTKEREQTSVPSSYPTVESQPEAVINDVRRVESIPFDEERVPNANRYVDEAPVVLDEGEAGERVLITRQLLVSGQVVSEEELPAEISRPARTRRVEYGTKEREQLTSVPITYPTVESQPEAIINEVRRVESIPFDEERVPNTNRYVDEAPIVLDEGEAGERVFITRQLIVSGQVVSEEELPAEISKPARTRRVEYGTKEREQVDRDKDKDGILDQLEIEAANRAIQNALEKLASYHQDRASALSDNLLSPKEHEALVEARAQVEEALHLAKQAIAEVPESDRTQLTALGSEDLLPVPSITDLDNDTKLDSDEVSQANAAIERANELVRAYETSLTGQTGPLSPSDYAMLSDLRTSAETAVRHAQSLRTDVPESLRESLVALTEHLPELPTVTDLDNDNKLDSDEVSQANAAIEEANNLIKTYQEKLALAKTDNRILDSEHASLQNERRLALEAIAKAKTLIADVPEARRSELTALKADTVEEVPQVTEEQHERFVEFRQVSQQELYKVDSNGALTRVTGLSSVPTDLSNYMVKLVNAGRDFLLPVSSITDGAEGFKVAVQYPRLKTYQGAQSDFTDNYQFVIDKTQTGQGIYTDFNSLIAAMKQNPSGDFKLGADMLATTASGSAYLDSFSGTLRSVDGKQYAIIGLQKPLVKTLSGGTISNIALKDVAITSQEDTATVAVTANNAATISKVAVTGRLTYRSASPSTNYIGGLVATASGAIIEKNSVNLTFDIADKATNNVSGLVGRSSSYFKPVTIRHNYVTGHMNLTNNSQSTVAGIVATDYGSTVQDNISDLSVRVVGDRVYGTNNQQVGDGRNGTITREAADAKRREWGMLSETPAPTQTATAPDYSVLPNYSSERAIAYRNTEKLLPLYDRKTIVHYGNLIDAQSNLYKKEIAHLILMTDNRFDVSGAYAPTTLLMRYTDGSQEKISLTSVGQFDQTGIQEYRFNDTLLYTPNSLKTPEDSFINSLADILRPLTLETQSVKDSVKLAAYNQGLRDSGLSYQASMADLYLDKSLETVKGELASHLTHLIRTSVTGDFSQDVVKRAFAKQVEEQKEKLLLGLTYLNRFYDISFGDYAIKDLVLYRPDAYHNAQSSLDWLSRLGGQSFEDLLPHNNETFFNKHMASHLGVKDLLAFLDKNRQDFSPTLSANDWFKSATKAFTHEEPSLVMPERSVAVYDRLGAKSSYKSYILPLLTLKEDKVYVVTTLSSLYLGGYGRTVDTALRTTDPTAYKAEVDKVHEKIKADAKRWRDYNDFYLKISDAKEQEILLSKFTEIYDGYYIKDSKRGTEDPYTSEKRRWADRYDRDYDAVYDFFGPIGRWYSKSPQNNSAYAIRNDNRIYFDGVDLLYAQGGATLNHELVHAYDEDVLLKGYGYREGQDTESYAYGLFESASSDRSYYYGFNFMYDLANGAYNHHISQFNNKEALKTYAKHLSDATYLLDGIEADIILAKSNQDKAYLLNKISLSANESTTKDNQVYHHGTDHISNLTEAELATMKLTTIGDLVRHNIVSKTNFMQPGDYHRDNNRNYYIVPLYYPIYAGYQNNRGTVGGLMFRRTAFDLLAEFGWDQGFVPYASNQYKAEATAQNKPLSDDIVFGHIFNQRFTSYADFKEKMFTERMAKKNAFKPIVIDGKTVSTYQELHDLLTTAIDQDLASAKLNKPGFAKETLKAKIVAAFNQKTNSFRESIFQDTPGEAP